MESVCVSSFFVKNECGAKSGKFESTEKVDEQQLKEVCEDMDMAELCKIIEQIESFDPIYDDALYQICAMVEDNYK